MNDDAACFTEQLGLGLDFNEILKVGFKLCAGLGKTALVCRYRD